MLPGETFKEWYERIRPHGWFNGYAVFWLRAAQSRKYKSRGNRSAKTVSITVNDIIALGKAQNYRCALSGIPFVNSDEKRHPFAPSIDRIDCSIGYEPGNVRIVCVVVNYALNNFGDETFLKMCRAVVANTSI